jgi:hypothetical protein
MTVGHDRRHAAYQTEQEADMSEMTHRVPVKMTEPKTLRRRATELGIAAYVVAAAVVVYGTYGDPHPKANQKSGVPFELVIGAIAAAVVFGALVPRALRAIREERAGSARWALTHSIVALVLAPVAFWSGLPVVLGAAGAWLGRRTAEQRATAGSPTRTATAAVTIGTIAVVVTILMAVLGNSVLSQP